MLSVQLFVTDVGREALLCLGRPEHIVTRLQIPTDQALADRGLARQPPGGIDLGRITDVSQGDKRAQIKAAGSVFGVAFPDQRPRADRPSAISTRRAILARLTRVE